MDAAAPAGTRRLRSLAAHVAPEHGVAPAGCVMAQGLAVAQPWLIAGLGSALWAAWPALMRQWRANPSRDALAGTALTQEQMEAFAQGLQAMAVAHAPGSISDANRNPRRVADVLHPKRVPMVALRGTQDQVIERTHANWVSDAAGALNRDEMCAINGLCNKLQAEHGVQLGVITMSGAGKGTDRSFATEIFNEWGVGDRDANSGVLIVLTGLSLGPGRKKCHIVTGDGIAGAALSDHTCDKIIQRSMLRELRRGDFGTALVKGAKAVSQIVERRSDNIARLGWRPPTKPEAEFGGGKRSGGSWPQPGGPWPPLALAGGAAVGSWHISRQRCDHCGKYGTATWWSTNTLPLDADWVDDAELALADLMDEEGRVPRAAAYTAITTAANASKTAALIEPGLLVRPKEARLPLRKGMLDQLFMLEVPEPEKDFERVDAVLSFTSRREREAYRKELQAASDRKGTADFTRLVMLLRQCATSGCLTDDVVERTYVCSSCGHAREPTYAKKASAGFEWDGGHAVAIPRDWEGNDGSRVRVALLCKRSGVRRFHGFHDKSDYRNRGAIIEDRELANWYAMDMMNDIYERQRWQRRWGVGGKWDHRDEFWGGSRDALWADNGIHSYGTSSGDSSSGSSGGGGGSDFGGGSSGGGGASASF